MGFPPIPHATAADLVAVRGIISSVILNHFDKRRHFVMSGMARGGFSGGPVFLLGNSPVAVGAAPAAGDHDGTIIGVVTSALTSADDYGNPLPAELGFMAAVSISTVFEAINYHGLDQAGH